MIAETNSSGITVVTVMLAFAAGVSVGFTMGRFFERMEFVRKGYRLPSKKDGRSRIEPD